MNVAVGIASDQAPVTATAVPRGKSGTSAPLVSRPILAPWLQAQATNVTRHAAALRPFKRGEFGPSPAAPTEGHILAVNTLMDSLRAGLIDLTGRVTTAAREAKAEPTSERLTEVMVRKDVAHKWVQGIEKIWDFYFELFGQRQSNYGDWLLSCDRIALDCYQVAYTGLGAARPIPAPPPFCYMRTGFAPATYRRGIPLTKLGRQLNPFPLVQLPYHRLVNPWTLGAMLHETSHNLQSDLGLGQDVPRRILGRLVSEGVPRAVAKVWARWNREMFADMSALLLGGPEILGSLMDVVGRAPRAVFSYSPRVPHPTPYLRTLISVQLLGRMGFPLHAERYRRVWTRIYPDPKAGNIPHAVIDTFPDACAAAVDEMCFKPYPTLGGKSLAQVMHFGVKEQQMIEEAAGRLAAGVDPGVVPERFLIGAARFALDNKLARPGALAENFYKELSRR
jgi:hypothetical protein